MATPHYVIRGGLEGRERLRVLARVMWPTTSALFSRIGVESTARCLDVGCGGGDVTVALARLAPAGSVVGTDLDETKLELARVEARDAGLRNVEFRVEDVTEPPSDPTRFDVVYARFVLTHLPDPARALHHVRHRLAPGGVLILEDIDCRGHFCQPDSAAFRRYVDLYTRAAEARGCDPNIGPRLPTLLREAGLRDIGMNVVHPAGVSGEVKQIASLTLDAIADALLAAGLVSADDLNRLAGELASFANTDGSLLSMPRIVQAWGRDATGPTGTG
jgi:SAM-dependent methyltransferase